MILILIDEIDFVLSRWLGSQRYAAIYRFALCEAVLSGDLGGSGRRKESPSLL